MIINQNRIPDALPDFRNLGTMLRIVLSVNGFAMLAALLGSKTFGGFASELAICSVTVQPSLLISLLILYAANRPLHRLTYPAGVVSVAGIAMATAGLALIFFSRMLLDRHPEDLARALLYSLTCSLILLFYFRLRNRALSPALAEARLQALQARIRPHFLFNSINAVLSLIRSQPLKAERGLEDLCDLFRVIMAENNQLSPLSAEVRLAQQYLALEALRLGDRLQVEWHTDNAPGDAMIPPLLIQPLVENAVYHGIEPSMDPGVISVNIFRSRNEVHIDIRNPYQHNGDHHAGNKMALNNIRERLALHFDAEASLVTKVGSNFYQVHITLPCRGAIDV